MQNNYTTIDITEQEKWNRALKNVPHSFTHTVQFCRSVQLDSGDKTFLYLFEKDGIKICCPLTERDFNGSTDIAKPFGISGFTGNGLHPDFYETWMEFINSKGYLTCYSGVNPFFGRKEWFPSNKIYPHGTIQALDLKPDTETILSNMSQKRRKQFNNWEEVKFCLTMNRNDIKELFIDHYQEFLERKKAASYYFFSTKAIESFFRAEDSVVVGAVEDGKLIAATFFGYTNNIGDALFNLSLPGKNHYSAELIWYAILELKKRGVPLLNMGGGGGGIAEFKRRFGAYNVPLLSLKEVYNKPEYSRLVGSEKNCLDNFEGFFPAYRKNMGE